MTNHSGEYHYGALIISIEIIKNLFDKVYYSPSGTTERTKEESLITYFSCSKEMGGDVCGNRRLYDA